MNKNNDVELGGDLNELSLKNSEYEPNEIVFSIKNVEFIKFNETGFYYKGNLIEDDKEIYNIFKKFLNNEIHQESNALIELLKQALLFYANPDNYKKNDDSLYPLVSADGGNQAKFALTRLSEIEKFNQDMNDEYEKIETENFEEIINKLKRNKND